ncbi:histone deacetylase family protein [Teichococcus aerofrigidensis]
MRAFAHPDQTRHSPHFFLQRGSVRRNFEIPQRAEALLAALRGSGTAVETPPLVEPAALLDIHDAGYVAFLAEAAKAWAALPEKGPEVVANMHPSPEMLAQGARLTSSILARTGWYTADTACPIGPGSWESILSAASCALAAAGSVSAGGGLAYALSRPPGHHAYAARAGGHCYVNNSALAAERLRRGGAARVAIIDIDAHHGNGTQGIFWERDDVLTVSLHGDPAGYYPWYVGYDEERGGGRGLGHNHNLPLPRGSGDEAWLAALSHAVERSQAFRPDALVIPLGFDASEQEPLSFLKVTRDGFARAGALLAGLGLPTVLVQEGGYNVDLIGNLLLSFLDGWHGR